MRYGILRALLAVSMRGFFRRITVQGRSLIPSRGPVLFVANHTNAFVDPLVLLTSIDRRVTLTAKSTLAANPLLAILIRGLGVVLLHRRQDEPDEARRADNVGALDRCVDVLKAGGAVLVFPEGVSHSDPGMRPFKTGAARIVMSYLEDPTVPPLSIVPVGLHFSRKDRWRSDATALVGPPLDAEVLANEETDAHALTERLRREVERLTANFTSEEERALIFGAGRLMEYDPEGPEPLDRDGILDARAHVDRVSRLQRGAHELRARDPELFESLRAETAGLVEDLRETEVEPRELSLPMHVGRVALFAVREMEVLLVGAPLALVGGALHLIPFVLTRRVVRALSEDEDHPASNAVFLSIPIFMTWWLLLGASALLVGVGWLLAAAVTVPFTGLVYLRYRDRGTGTLRRLRSFLRLWRDPGLKRELEARLQVWRDRLERIERSLIDNERRGTSDV